MSVWVTSHEKNYENSEWNVIVNLTSILASLSTLTDVLLASSRTPVNIDDTNQPQVTRVRHRSRQQEKGTLKLFIRCKELLTQVYLFIRCKELKCNFFK